MTGDWALGRPPGNPCTGHRMSPGKRLSSQPPSGVCEGGMSFKDSGFQTQGLLYCWVLWERGRFRREVRKQEAREEGAGGQESLGG